MKISETDLKHSRHMCYILRHKPEERGITLDEQGWADAEEVANAVGIDALGLVRIVDQDPKGRYELAGGMIRCVNGHSCGVVVDHPIEEPPAVLYHGTTTLAAEKIDVDGIRKMRRSTVHLTADESVAEAVGKRHKGKLHVYKVDARRMHADGHMFQRGPKGLWFVDHVPVEYISRREEA